MHVRMQVAVGALWSALSRRHEFDRLPVAALKAAQEAEQYAHKAASWEPLKPPPVIESILDYFAPMDLDGRVQATDVEWHAAVEAERQLAVKRATAASKVAQEDARAAVLALQQLEEVSQACGGWG